MKCPVDQQTLVMSDRQGIEIDYCPDCRGVWLDRGELDKIIERSGAGDGRDESPRAQRDHRDDDEGRRPGRSGKKKREGFLSEIFEFGS